MMGLKILALSFVLLLVSKMIIRILKIIPRKNSHIVTKCFINFKLRQILPVYMFLAYFISTLLSVFQNQNFTPECEYLCQFFQNSVPHVRNMDEPQSVHLSPVQMTAIMILFTLCLRYLSTLTTTSPSLYPKKDKNSIHCGSCDICHLKDYPHVYHGTYTCTYHYDHTCPWVASDIGLSNKLTFYKLIVCLVAFSGLVWSYYIQCMVLTYRWHFATFPTDRDQLFFERLTFKSSALILYAMGNPYNAIQNVLQLMVFFPAFVQVFQQIFTLRYPMCYSSYAYAKKMLKAVKKGRVVAGRAGELVYFVGIPKGETNQEVEGKITVDGESIEVIYEKKEETMNWLKEDVKTTSIADNFRYICQNQQVARKW